MFTDRIWQILSVTPKSCRFPIQSDRIATGWRQDLKDPFAPACRFPTADRNVGSDVDDYRNFPIAFLSFFPIGLRSGTIG